MKNFRCKWSLFSDGYHGWKKLVRWKYSMTVGWFGNRGRKRGPYSVHYCQNSNNNNPLNILTNISFPFYFPKKLIFLITWRKSLYFSLYHQSSLLTSPLKVTSWIIPSVLAKILSPSLSLSLLTVFNP